MSLPDARVLSILQRDYVLAWKNIRREPYAGDSLGYSSRQDCIGTTNGAGGHNVQLFMVAPDRTVLHALPGFWHPADLAHELRFGLQAWRLWRDTGRSVAQKRAMYRRMVLTDLHYQSAAAYARSDWQDFDRVREGQLGAAGRDTFARRADGTPERALGGALVLKPLNVLAHQRMATRAFLPFEDFDVAAFVDYGNRYYDNNRLLGGKGRRLK